MGKTLVFIQSAGEPRMTETKIINALKQLQKSDTANLKIVHIVSDDHMLGYIGSSYRKYLAGVAQVGEVFTSHTSFLNNENFKAKETNVSEMFKILAISHIKNMLSIFNTLIIVTNPSKVLTLETTYFGEDNLLKV
jgi:hypothetical protein